MLSSHLFFVDIKVDINSCQYLIDLDYPEHPRSSDLEPRYAVDQGRLRVWRAQARISRRSPATGLPLTHQHTPPQTVFKRVKFGPPRRHIIRYTHIYILCIHGFTRTRLEPYCSVRAWALLACAFPTLGSGILYL